jgi:serine/threonine protein kinase
MVDALLISHEQKIVQKNLKLSSVLLVKDQKNKICDFNAAKQLETFHLQT